MRFKHFFAIAAAVFLLSAAVFTFLFSDHFRVSEKQDSFTIYTGSYPMYALGSRIVKDIPGMELLFAFQPQDQGQEEYALSDWDRAYMESCDVILLTSGGFESYETEISGGSTAVISTVNGLKYSIDGVDVYGKDRGEALQNPWLFLGVDGAKQICEAITANMLALDEVYTSNYYQNLSEALLYLDELSSKIDSYKLNENIKVAAAHKAFYYTCEDLNLDCTYIIERLPASEIGDNELNEILNDLRERSIGVLLVEKQAPAALTAFFEQNGITVIRLNLMTDLTANDGIESFGKVLTENAKEIYMRLSN